jgi:uncharacterized protein
LCKPKADVESITKLVCQTITEKMNLDGLSSMHWLFVDEPTSKRLATQGNLTRRSVQFQWFNRDYANFNDFLATMNSRKRKSIRSERTKISQSEITVERLTGSTLLVKHINFFYHCYQQTYLKRSGHGGYLTQAFFDQIFQTMHEKLLIVEAKRDGTPIASALFFYDETQLYGRYWGALDDVSQLHFECCYYQGIEFCIERGLAEFNPGTQGEHKIMRGFEPQYCFSNHQLKELAFHDAVGRFIATEDLAIQEYKLDAEALLPFKKTTDEV